MAACEELGEWSERDSSSSQCWKGSKIVAHNVDMPLSMISSSSFSSCNLLRGIPQKPQKMMMVPTTYICPVSLSPLAKNRKEVSQDLCFVEGLTPIIFIIHFFTIAMQFRTPRSPPPPSTSPDSELSHLLLPWQLTNSSLFFSPSLCINSSIFPCCHLLGFLIPSCMHVCCCRFRGGGG